MNGFLILAPAMLFILFAVLIFPIVVTRLLRRRFLDTPRSNDAVYLTFDDGPAADTTPMILELLADANAKATFFVVGLKARQHPRLVADILEQGHEVGSHGFAHLHPWRVSPLRSLRDLQSGISELTKLGLSQSGFLRPPYGKFGFMSAFWVLATRQQPAFWSIDPRDYSAESAEEVVGHVLDRVCGGSVILFHDGVGGKGRRPELIIEVVRILLAEISDRGLRFAKLSG